MFPLQITVWFLSPDWALMYRKREIKTETKSQQYHSGWLTLGGVVIGLFYFGLCD